MKKTRKVARKKQAAGATATAEKIEHESIEYNPTEFADNVAKASKLWQEMASYIISGLVENSNQPIGHTDTYSMTEPFFKLAGRIASDPTVLFDTQMHWMKSYVQLWQDTTDRLLGKTNDNVEPINDRRFKHEAWQDSAYFDFLKRSYLINSEWLQNAVNRVEGLDEHTAHRLNFFARQFIDAVSPSNFLFTNPEALEATIETNGQNLVKGFENMLEDIRKGNGKLRISMADESAFKLGEDLAATPGHVIYENELMQLIQYEPSTEKVHQTPLLMIPAWINKYYVLDMREQNSLVKWAVDQGYTVFVISWVNPDESLSDKDFENYLSDGPIKALEVIEQITKSDQTSLIGYCLGGTLTATLLAYLHANGEQDRIASATYLTTMIDFSDAGELSVFIDDAQLQSLEERMSGQGYLNADDMAATFNMLRANDLIWSFYINNYLLGKDPFPFDLLYWNSDSTRMPAKMHSFYLRNMYQKNLLAKPAGIELMGTPIHLNKIKTPSYILSTKEDHIAPWQSTYAATHIYDAPVRFVLAQSGHIAGVINPPSKKKYGYWTNNKLALKPDTWLENATFVQDSWWSDWHKWQKQFSAKKVKARKVGNKQYPAIEAAPGAFARIRS
ncbi:MAG: class I poly(R)-hydroxyalkanoic acid synthase [Rickettsiales bacterium]|nr:class I poly(R)-hydroxyalkanoic acid synthase [Rickettsiales bacterium]